MAERNPDETVSFDELLRIVDQLPAEQKERLRVILNSKSRAEIWDALCGEVAERSKGLPPLTEEEVMEEVKKVRSGFFEYLRNQPDTNL